MQQQVEHAHVAPLAEARDHGGARGRRDGRRLGGVAENVFDRVGQQRRIVRHDKDAVARVIDDFGDARDRGRNDRNAHRHRFEDDIGNTVAIAVGVDPAGESEQARRAQPIEHCIMRHFAEQTNAIAELQRGDQRCERRFFGTVTDDLAGE